MRAALTVECAPLGTSSLLHRKRKAARALRGHSRRILRRSKTHRPDLHIHSAKPWRRMANNSRFTTERLPWARRKAPSTSTHPSGRPPANRDGHRAQLQPDEKRRKQRPQEREYDGILSDSATSPTIKIYSVQKQVRESALTSIQRRFSWEIPLGCFYQKASTNTPSLFTNTASRRIE